MSNEPFNGLTMPVFTAFGWAGQEQAIQFALTQLEEFIKQMHLRLSRETQTIFPQRGLDKTTQGVFLARDLETQRDLYMTFHATMSALRYAIVLNDRVALARALKAIQNDQSGFYDAVSEMGDDWELRVQQMEYDPETDEATTYKDVFKGGVSTLTPSDTAEIIDRAAYLNGEEKWLATIEFTRRVPAEFVSAMGSAVVGEIAKEVDGLLPVLRYLTGGVKRSSTRKKTSTKKRAAAEKKETTSASKIAQEETLSFTYVTQLKPLHIRRGFVNMTEAHWPFFSINSRTTTREVILKYEGNIDKRSAVWRMVPSDKARLVLSDAAQEWLEDNFSPNDEIQITAKKHGPDKKDKIEIELELVR